MLARKPMEIIFFFQLRNDESLWFEEKGKILTEDYDFHHFSNCSNAEQEEGSTEHIARCKVSY